MKKILILAAIVICVAVFGFLLLSKLKTNITNSTGGDASNIVYDRYNPSKETKSGDITLEISTNNNEVSGKTDGNIVFVNDKEIAVGKSGEFSIMLILDEGENIVVVTAVGNSSYWEKEIIVTHPGPTNYQTINEATVKSKTDKNLMVIKDSEIYEVNILSSTKFRPRYWGESTINEIQIGDTLNIIGGVKDNKIDAFVVRDLSIQKRFGVLVGKVQSIDNNVFTILHNERGNQIVTASQKPDIKVGQEVLVQGMWDRSANIVRDVTKIIVLK